MNPILKKVIFAVVLLVCAFVVMKAFAPSKEVVTDLDPNSTESKVMSFHEQMMMNRGNGGGVPHPQNP